MKLEKLSDNQIRCTLTSEDLASRHIRLAELAYGSEKAKSLFRDMMSQAHKKFGFDAENIPLMIEAIPVSADSIMLIITKVEDPEELDTRFARFAPHQDPSGSERPGIEDADDILNIIQKLYEAKMNAAAPKAAGKAGRKPVGSSSASAKKSKAGNAPAKGTAANGITEDGAAPSELDYVRIYHFGSLDEVIAAASAVGSDYKNENTLYKTGDPLPYTLVLHKSDLSADVYNRICNRLAEYGEAAPCMPAQEARLKEHAQVIRSDDALQTLAML